MSRGVLERFQRPLDIVRLVSRSSSPLAQNRVLCHFGDSEFECGFGWNPDLLLCLGIKTRACLPLLFHQLAKAGENEFAVLFDFFVREAAERFEEYPGGLLTGLGCCGESELKFCFGHLLILMAGAANEFKGKT